MVETLTNGIDKDSWCRQRLVVLTTPMILAWNHGIEKVLLNHTHTKGPSVTRMQDLKKKVFELVDGGSVIYGPTLSIFNRAGVAGAVV